LPIPKIVAGDMPGRPTILSHLTSDSKHVVHMQEIQQIKASAVSMRSTAAYGIISDTTDRIRIACIDALSDYFEHHFLQHCYTGRHYGTACCRLFCSKRDLFVM